MKKKTATIRPEARYNDTLRIGLSPPPPKGCTRLFAAERERRNRLCSGEMKLRLPKAIVRILVEIIPFGRK